MSVSVCVGVGVGGCTWEPGEQTVELSLSQRGPGQVQRGGLTFDDACQRLVGERAAPTHVHVTPQTLVAAPAEDSKTRSAAGDEADSHTQIHVKGSCVTYHLYQALQTVMQASSSARSRYLNTDTQTSFSPPRSLPTSLKDGRDRRDGGDREEGA